MNVVQGDLFSVKNGIVVHGCNSRGVMGAGVAKIVKDTYPFAFQAYHERHLRVGLLLGDVISVAPFEMFSDEKFSSVFDGWDEKASERNVIVCNAITQRDFGRDPNKVYVDYEAVSSCFARIGMIARVTGMAVNFPMIGCGLANGRWDKVRPLIEQALGPGVSSTLWTL